MEKSFISIAELLRQYFTFEAKGFAYDVASATCKYRLEIAGEAAPRKCAVGCLLPDDVYDRGMEGCGAWALLWNNSEVCEIFGIKGLGANSPTARFLGTLQHCHDTFAKRVFADRSNEAQVMELFTFALDGIVETLKNVNVSA